MPLVTPLLPGPPALPLLGTRTVRAPLTGRTTDLLAEVVGDPAAQLLRSVEPSEVFGWAAVVVGILGAWPQVLRVVRTRSTQGVSWVSAVLGALCMAVWLGYGVVVSDHVQVANNLLALLAAGTLCGLLMAYARPRVLPALSLAVGVLGVALAAWLGAGAVGLAVAASLLSIARMVPQVRLALGSSELFGLCPWSTLLGLLAAVLWLGYGLAVTDVAVTVTSFVAAGLYAVVTLRRLPPRRTTCSLAAGRLGPVVARAAGPLAGYMLRTQKGYPVAS